MISFRGGGGGGRIFNTPSRFMLLSHDKHRHDRTLNSHAIFAHTSNTQLPRFQR